MNIHVALWNVEWATPKSRRADPIRRILAEQRADVICLTEGTAALLPEAGHILQAEGDYGYGAATERRKVLLWSRWPWLEVDSVGSPDLPSGRFIRAVLSTPRGPVTIVGVCIPWSHARVSSGPRNRVAWEDHATYLRVFKPLIAEAAGAGPLILTGDFNQRIPTRRAPAAVQQLLTECLQDLNVSTAGAIPGIDKLSIDHLAHSRAFTTTAIAAWPGTQPDGFRLSDHPGLKITLRYSDSPERPAH